MDKNNVIDDNSVIEYYNSLICNLNNNYIVFERNKSYINLYISLPNFQTQNFLNAFDNTSVPANDIKTHCTCNNIKLYYCKALTMPLSFILIIQSNNIDKISDNQSIQKIISSHFQYNNEFQQQLKDYITIQMVPISSRHIYGNILKNNSTFISSVPINVTFLTKKSYQHTAEINLSIDISDVYDLKVIISAFYVMYSTKQTVTQINQ